jgi:flagellar basal-body rod protein FlgC
MADLKDSMFIAGSGMQAQSTRMRVISENIANADSTASTPGGDPYRRKTISFKNVLDKELQVNMVRVKNIGTDPKEFEKDYAPGHPAAAADHVSVAPREEAFPRARTPVLASWNFKRGETLAVFSNQWRSSRSSSIPTPGCAPKRSR